MNLKWSSKFELKPGKWVFVPTADSIDEGRKIKQSIENKWKVPSYYYHLRSGGHVEALKSHLGHSSFLRIDIQDFFGSINRTRVTRCLKSKFDYVTARAWANASTVIDPANKKRSFIPFGFVQSQIIASLCLAESALGICLSKIRKNKNVSISVYVDDIIISTCNAEVSVSILEMLKLAANRARFTLNAQKQEGPAPIITAFNIVLANASIEIDEARLKMFVQALEQATNEHQRKGIVDYVKSINVAQAMVLVASERLSNPSA